MHVALVLLEHPRNSSRSKAGPKVGFGACWKAGQKQVKSTQIPILLTYLKNLVSEIPLKPTFGPTFDLLEILRPRCL